MSLRNPSKLSQPGMKKNFLSNGGSVNILAVILVVLIVVVGGAALLSRPASAPQNEASHIDELSDEREGMPNSNNGDVNPPKNEAPAAPSANVIIFSVVAKNYSFSPANIRVKKGERVRVDLVVQEGFHDWVVDEFNARSAKTSAGNTVSVEFVADKIGTFESYCSVGQHRQAGMVGRLIVEE